MHTRLRWNEDSPFETSADVGTHDEVVFYYVTAVLDLLGESGVRQLANVSAP